jgi:CheY-like chemotaxis protein
VGKKILLADDSLTIQKVVELTLSGTDYELTCVSNGRKAIDSLRASRPDLILADVVMPEKNGYEVCEEVKGDPATARIPVVLLSGTFEPFDRERADRVGSDLIVSKPFDAHQLLERIDALLARSPAAPAAFSPEEESAPFEAVSFDDTLPAGGHAAAATEVNPFGPDHDFSFSEPSESRDRGSVGEPPWPGPESEPLREAAPASSEKAPSEEPAPERSPAGVSPAPPPPPAVPRHAEVPIEEISAEEAEVLFDVPCKPEPLSPGAAAPAGPELTEAQIEAIAARVVEKLSDRVVREIAWDVVPDLAERAVKRRIEELEREPD